MSNLIVPATAREITDHHDGHGLAESLRIISDVLDANAGGAAHNYEIFYDTPNPMAPPAHVATIQFQHGPRDVEGSIPGALDSCLLAIVLDRLRSFQAGPFPSRENALVITKIEEALHWMRHRADARAKRGVLGRNEK